MPIVESSLVRTLLDDLHFVLIYFDLWYIKMIEK